MDTYKINSAPVYGVIMGPCTQMVREKLIQQVNPADLAARVESNSNKLVNLAKKIPKELENYEEFDLVMLCKLLRTEEICSVEKTTLNDVKSLKAIRDRICHLPKPEISLREFEDVRSTLLAIADRWDNANGNGPKYVTEIFELCQFENSEQIQSSAKEKDIPSKSHNQETDECDIKESTEQIECIYSLTDISSETSDEDTDEELSDKQSTEDLELDINVSRKSGDKKINAKRKTDATSVDKGIIGHSDNSLKGIHKRRYQKNLRTFFSIFAYILVLFANFEKARRHGSYGSNNTGVKKNLFAKKPPEPGIESMHKVKELGRVSEAVGIIGCGVETFGTGFSVGDDKVMTTLHVITQMYNIEDQLSATLKNSILRKMKKSQAYIKFDYELPFEATDNVYIDKDFLYIDTDCDVAVLKLLFLPDQKKPPSFKRFGNLRKNEQFDFIGHPDGHHKHRDIACRCIDVTTTEIMAKTSELSQLLSVCGSAACYPGPYDGIYKPHYDLFHCSFEHAASGSPGVRIDNEGKVEICSMLLGGFPTNYWTLSQNVQKPKFRVEYGSKMQYIYEKMKVRDLGLCKEIFQIHKW